MAPVLRTALRPVDVEMRLVAPGGDDASQFGVEALQRAEKTSGKGARLEARHRHAATVAAVINKDVRIAPELAIASTRGDILSLIAGGQCLTSLRMKAWGRMFPFEYETAVAAWHLDLATFDLVNLSLIAGLPWWAIPEDPLFIRVCDQSLRLGMPLLAPEFAEDAVCIVVARARW
jgi:hypothetical protein